MGLIGRRSTVWLLAAVLVLASSCTAGDDDADVRSGMGEMGDADRDRMGGMDSGGALGDSARTTILAEVTVRELPDEPLAWSGFVVEEQATHAHERSFVYAHDDSHVVVVDGERRELAVGESTSIAPGIEHTHEGAAWETLLAEPGVAAPEGATPEPLFASDVLEGVPDPPAKLRFILVELPPGSQTSVHTHPGPEYVHTTRGSYTYESAVTGEASSTAGDDHTLEADTPVQKRNSGDEAAEFLSWFIIDPDEPFAPSATFGMG